ncbi:MAG: M20/M25/M40 family metallo-hydrolase [Planctomycetes bacterium]|nr:M20/M25/M40 family metallo-hydrolase [Planctomycetota bacterium]
MRRVIACSWRLVVVLALVLPSRAVSAQAEAQAGAEADPLGLSTVTLEEITAHMRYLCDDARQGREAGGDENRKVMEYVAAEFKSYGLEPAGDDGGWFQTVDKGPAVYDGPDSAVTIQVARGANGRGQPRSLALAVGKDFSACAGSPAKEATGGVAFAGYAISSENYDYDDFDGLDVKGKVVIVLRGEPQENDVGSRFSGKRKVAEAADNRKAEEAQKRGAVAVLLAHNRNWKDPDVAVNVFSVKPRRRGATLEIPVAHVTRRVAAGLMKGAGKNLEEIEKAIDDTGKPLSCDLPGVTASVRADARTRFGGNVIGLLRGADPELKKEVVVLGAHMDHIGFGGFGSQVNAVGVLHNGADDNASGAAALLEAAEAVASAPVKPRRSVLFIAFNAEEKGLFGAFYYCAHPHPEFPIANTAAMVNMDMVGRLRNNRVEVIAAETGGGFFQPLVNRTNERFGLNLKLAYPFGMASGSDQLAFIMRQVPSIFMHTGLHPDYHTPVDDLDRINLEGMAPVTRLVAATTQVLANYPKRATFKPQPMLGLGFGGPRGPLLGISVGRPPEGEENPQPGVYVGGIMEGYASETLGLDQGDIVVEMDGAALKDQRDLQRALRKHKWGEKVSVKWVRDGKTMAGEAVLTNPEGDEEQAAAPQAAPGGGPGVVCDAQVASKMEKMLGVKGLQTGDRIVEVNGQPVADLEALQVAILTAPPGKPIQIAWERGGKRMTAAGSLDAEEPPPARPGGGK